MYITLNEVEQRLAKHLAARITKARKDRGETDRKQGPQSQEQTDLEGFAAEIAFCRMMNIYPDIQVGEQHDADCVLKNGITVNVKTTVYSNGKLLCARWKKPNVDLFALMVGTFPTYFFAGFMTAEELLREERMISFGNGKCYSAEQLELFKTGE